MLFVDCLNKTFLTDDIWTFCLISLFFFSSIKFLSKSNCQKSHQTDSPRKRSLFFHLGYSTLLAYLPFSQPFLCLWHPFVYPQNEGFHPPPPPPLCLFSSIPALRSHSSSAFNMCNSQVCKHKIPPHWNHWLHTQTPTVTVSIWLFLPCLQQLGSSNI